MKKLTIEINEIEQMIFVATLPRSGSSMDCGILEACGAFGGKTIGCVAANKKGIFENRGLNSMLLSPIFEEIEIRNPRGLLTVHKSGGPPAELFADFRQDLTYGLNKQGYKGGVAYFKNGVYTFMFNRINELFPDAIWVLPYRNANSVVKSTQRINPNKPIDKIKNDIKDYRFMYDHIQREAGERAFLINNDELMGGDYSEMKAVVEKAGLKWDEEAVTEWIDPALWGESKYVEEDVAVEEAKKPQNGGNNHRPSARA